MEQCSPHNFWEYVDDIPFLISTDCLRKCKIIKIKLEGTNKFFCCNSQKLKRQIFGFSIVLVLNCFGYKLKGNMRVFSDDVFWTTDSEVCTK